MISLTPQDEGNYSCRDPRKGNTSSNHIVLLGMWICVVYIHACGVLQCAVKTVCLSNMKGNNQSVPCGISSSTKWVTPAPLNQPLKLPSLWKHFFSDHQPTILLKLPFDTHFFLLHSLSPGERRHPRLLQSSTWADHDNPLPLPSRGSGYILLSPVVKRFSTPATRQSLHLQQRDVWAHNSQH